MFWWALKNSLRICFYVIITKKLLCSLFSVSEKHMTSSSLLFDCRTIFLQYLFFFLQISVFAPPAVIRIFINVRFVECAHSCDSNRFHFGASSNSMCDILLLFNLVFFYISSYFKRLYIIYLFKTIFLVSPTRDIYDLSHRIAFNVHMVFVYMRF